MRRINFCYNHCGWRAGFAYRAVLDSLIDPIREHLLDCTTSDLPAPGALNVQFLREIKHQQGVFISHGIADKNYRNARAVAGFDWVAVSGPAWTEKYIRQGIPRERILEVGYTKLDPIFQGRIVGTRGPRPRVLWAPTHAAWGATSSFQQGQDLIRRLPRLYEPVWAPHPVQKPGHTATLQELVDADIVIADSGSTLYEAWALGKPVVFPDWLVAEGVKTRLRGSFEDRIYREGIGYHARSFEHLTRLLRTALDRGIDQAAREFIDRIFPLRLRGRSGEVTARALTAVASLR